MLASDKARPSRIVVLGCSGSGKSTLASALAEKLGLPFRPTDEVQWRPDWAPAPPDDVREWLERETCQRSWVLDGNFDAHRDLVWGRAEMAVWLDPRWATTVFRVLRRNLHWWITRIPVWGGPRMTLPRAISGVGHAARSHGAKRRSYPEALLEFPRLHVVRIRSNTALKAWLDSLGPSDS